MHKEILTDDQVALLSIVKNFSKNFILVGGTAIALHLGHRRSIDFDLFSFVPFNNEKIKKLIVKYHKINKTIVNQDGEFTMRINDVKFTFFEFSHPVPAPQRFEKVIRIPDLLTLAAMKIFALGYRRKWKDYVDLYFIIKDHYSLDKISERAKELFKGEFNAKILRGQLSFFDDVDYREKVEFMPGFEVSNNKIKKALVEFSLS